MTAPSVRRSERGGVARAKSDRLVVRGIPVLRASPMLPGDKSISHRALLLGLLGEGRSEIRGISGGADVRTTAAVIARLGASVIELDPVAGCVRLAVESDGIDHLVDPRAVASPLDCENSGTTLRLVAGILAGQPVTAILDGDASLRRRPVGRIAEPLKAMGAELHPSGTGTPPLRVHGRSSLRRIDWLPAAASAQVKSAILLAALRADGTTRVHEPMPTRDHTERMLRARGVPVRTLREDREGTVVELDGPARPTSVDVDVPGDASAAAFWLVAGAAHPDARIELRDVGINPGRRGALDILRDMGASITETSASSRRSDNAGDAAADREPAADLVVRSSDLRAIDVDPRRAVAAIDEIPILAVAATQARGVTTLRGLGELRVKESDRLTAIVDGLSAFGAKVSVEGDDVQIVGPTPLHGTSVDGLGDHRLVMTFAIAGLLASGITTIHGASSAGISDPGFVAALERIRT